MNVRMRALWGAMILIVLPALGAFAVISARRLGVQDPPRGRLAADLTARVTTLMEQDFRTLTTQGGEPVACTARPFGVRPENLTRASEATTIYAWVHCRTDGGETLLDPVALRLGSPPTVRVPQAGDERDRSLRRIFPADVRAAMQGSDLSVER
jgi:hypothetical protein